MSNLVVVAFDNEEEASQVRAALAEVQNYGGTVVNDAAVVVKDANGEVRVKHETDTGVKTGAVGGGLLGLFIGFLFGGPIVGAVVLALGGGLVGSLADMGVSKDFVNEVKEAMQPRTSALFVIVRDSDAEVALAALRPYKGNVIHTTLPTELEESLQRVLAKRS